MAPFGDYLLSGYAVDCERASIRVMARSTTPPRATELVFAGVAAYRFESDAFGTVLGDVIELPVDVLVERLAEMLRAGWAADGWPRSWGAHPSVNQAATYLAQERIRAFELTSAIGMHGWVLARSFETRALDPLAAIDWAHLTSRLGPDSSAIPGYLRGLASGDENLQRDAALSLAVTLLHDGDHAVFDATPNAVPFIREIASTEGLAGRSHALVLLREIATFTGDAYLLDGIRQTDLCDAPDRWPFDQSILAVMEGYGEYVRIAVGDPDAAARCAAAQLVGILITSMDPREALREAVAGDRDERTRASLALALGLQLRARGDRDVAVLEPLLDGGDAWLGPAAAIAIGLAEGNTIGEAHLQKLEDVEAMERDKDFDFWNEGLLGNYASKVLPPVD